jgi:choline dehydrogenase-like flavoprotein
LRGKGGLKWTATARREIIISAGVYCTPAILMRSGIGTSENLNEVGIKTLVDIPGVGRNLMDHPVCLFSRITIVG